MTPRIACLVLVAGTGLSAPASAHLPYFATPANHAPATPFPLPDGKISRVVYAEMPCDRPQLWLEVSGRAGDEVLVQLGLPRMEPLRDYRPSIAIMGPGFPASSEPAMQGAPGVVLAPLAGGVKPFYEMFSNTHSWILVETTVTLPGDGTFRITAWDPQARAARLWIAVGKEEKFDMPVDELADALDRVKLSHEPPDDPAFGQPCAKAEVEGGGCASPPATLVAVAGLSMLRRRRRAARRPPGPR